MPRLSSAPTSVTKSSPKLFRSWSRDSSWDAGFRAELVLCVRKGHGMMNLDRAVMVLTRSVVNFFKLAIPILGVIGTLYGVLWFLDQMGWIDL